MNLGQAILEWMGNNISICILGAVTLIEVVPVKVNPIKWLGNKLNGDVRKELSDLKRDFEDSKANTMRWNILEFANSCRKGELHSKEEWQHVINQMADYEKYVVKHEIVNGVIEEDTKYLRNLYRGRNEHNDFAI